MQDFASKEDERLFHAVCDWIDTAREQIDYIEIQRECFDRGEALSFAPWPKRPKMFILRSATLFIDISTQFPNIDPAPVRDLGLIVEAWHDYYSEAALPDNLQLRMLLDRACLILVTVQNVIRNRMTDTVANGVSALSKTKPRKPPAFQNRVRIDERTTTITIDGQSFNRLTQRCFLLAQVLVAAKGAEVRSSAVRDAIGNRGRPDVIKKEMPPQLAQYVKSRKGYGGAWWMELPDAKPVR